MTSVRAMDSANSWRREVPSALSVGPSSASVAAWRASACASTRIPTSAARPVRIHHPTAWGSIEVVIAVAKPCRSVGERPPRLACGRLETE